MKNKTKVIIGITLSLIIITILSLVIIFSHNDVLHGRYVLSDDSDSSCWITLYGDNQFAFSFEMISPEVVEGAYKIKGDKLICSEAEEKKEYVFLIEEKKIIFSEDESTGEYKTDSFELKDGYAFVFTEIDYESTEGKTYILENGANDYCQLYLGDENSFSFSTSVLSSYMPIGTYEEKNGLLICKTDDGQREYRFEKDGDRLVFRAGESSKPDNYGEEYIIRDGEVFILQK